MTPVSTIPAGDDARLSKLIAAGLHGAQLQFGVGTEPVSAEQLNDDASQLFTASAASEAAVVIMTNDAVTVSTVLAAVTAGARLVSVPLPAATAAIDDYVQQVRSICISAHAERVFARDDIADLLMSAGIRAMRHSDASSNTALAAPMGGFELIQYSSGSTALPKGVRLSDVALGRNVASIIDAIDPQPGDHCVSWLPLSHDMGLIGMLLTSVASASPSLVGAGTIVLLDPLEFLRRPGLWLEALSAHRATITAAPDFGYAVATRAREETPLDLSTVRCAIVGGEIVRSRTLEQFVSRFSSAGFRPTSLCPAYGLAEVGLAASMTRPSESPRQMVVDTRSLSRRRLAVPHERDDATTLISSGRALSGYEVRCPSDGSVGDVRVRGPSIGESVEGGSSYADRDGWLSTGDLGFMRDHWLYVCGRTDDYLVANGRNIYAPALEQAVGEVPGIRTGRAASAMLPSGEWVLMVEPDERGILSDTEQRRLREDARRAAVRAASASPADVAVLPRGALPITPSGKLQRHRLVPLYLDRLASREADLLEGG